MREKFEGCIIGFVMGDVLGDPLETLSPEEIRERYGIVREPIKRSKGTDDTEMLRIVMRSIIEKRAYDPSEVAKRYLEWLPRAYRIGMTTRTALTNLKLSDLTYGAKVAAEKGLGRGNGPLMRMPPIALLHFFKESPEGLIKDSIRETLLTHYTPEAVTSSVIFSLFLVYIGRGFSPEESMEMIYYDLDHIPEEFRSYEAFFNADKALNYNLEGFRTCDAKGYIINSLKLAIASSFEEDYREAILQIVNLGLDTDTNAAVCGAVLGIKLGMSAIPKDWLQYIEEYEEILEEVGSLYSIASKQLSKLSESGEDR